MLAVGVVVTVGLTAAVGAECTVMRRFPKYRFNWIILRLACGMIYIKTAKK